MGPADACTALLAQHPRASRWVVAFSGGMDSCVLLESCLEALAARGGTPSLAALHVDHGVHPDAQEWARRCEAFCTTRGVPFHLRHAAPGTSGEEGLRRERYRAFEAFCGEEDLLVLAHHREDQAETVLLRLLRGAGPSGLSGMPSTRPCGRATLCRPFLGLPRSALRAFAESRGLGWIDDPSNEETAYARNYLRHRVMPLLEERWPGAAGRIARAAAHCADAAAVCGARAEDDLRACAGTDRFGQPRFELAPWRALDGARRRLVLREWLHGRPAVTAATLQTLVEEVIDAGPDRQPRLVIGDAVVRRFDDALYLLPRRADRPVPPAPFTLEPGHHGRLPGAGRVALLPEAGPRGVRRGGVHRVEFRRPGLACRLPGRPEKPLKQVLAEAGVPPWLRDSVPLLFVDGRLAAVAGLGPCEGFEARPGEPAVSLLWTPADEG